jgi:polar amino acid transport system substrate-binding protein
MRDAFTKIVLFPAMPKSRTAFYRVWFLTALLLFAVCPGGSVAHAQVQDAPPGRSLRIATRVITPFVVRRGNRYSGFSIELWEAIADRLKLTSTYQPYPSVVDLLGAVRGGQADVGVAAISITSEREHILDFSQPIIEGGLQILVRDVGNGGAQIPSLFTVLFSKQVLQLLGVMSLVTLLPAHLIWFFERRREDGILENKAYFPGIFKAMWWAGGTLGAQADEMPRTVLGRLVALLWMFTSIVFVAYFTAAVTTAFTVGQLRGAINGPDDLPGKRVATTIGSTAEKYVKAQRARVQSYTGLEECYRALHQGQVDAVVFDSPVLLYYAAHEGKGRVQVVGSVFKKEGYGIVMPRQSPLRKPINTALLSLQEDGTYQRIYDRWFGEP